MNQIIFGTRGLPYRLQDKISEGGFGDVFLAEQIGSGRTVAVKVLRDYRNADALRHFRREVEVLHSLGINGIIELLDYNLNVQPPFFIMPYMSGGTLSKWAGKLALPNFVSIARWLTNLVLQLHSKNQVHRDIKPDNILVDGAGELRIADFGLGNDPRFTMVFTGHGAGTRGYAAPEVAVYGQIPTRASDIYSLGATLFHLLTGIHPSKAASFDLWNHSRAVPKELRDAVLEMLRPVPEQRPSAQQLLFRLAGLNLAEQAPSPPPPPPPRRQQSSDAGAWGAAAIGLLFLVGLGVAAGSGKRRR